MIPSDRPYSADENLSTRTPVSSQVTLLIIGGTALGYPGLTELRQRQKTAAGRARLREHTGIERSLAQVVRWKGDHARYRGARENLFDLRGAAAVHNRHVLAGTGPYAQAMAA